MGVISIQYVVIIAAALTFYLGITLPLLVFERLFFFEKEASLLLIIRGLWDDQAWPLALIVGLFSVVFPALKLVYLTIASAFPHRLSSLPGVRHMSTLSKWSMMDVLVVAIIIVATKTSGLAKATAQPGLWCFTAAILLMTIATLMVQRQTSSRR